MKKNILLLSAILLFALFSCEKEEQPVQISDLSELKLVDSKTELNVALWTPDGVKIQTSEQMKPNSEYILKLKSKTPISFKVTMVDGITVDSNQLVGQNMSDEFDLKVKTFDEISPFAYIKLVPILRNDKGFVKEMPQNFLLPNM